MLHLMGFVAPSVSTLLSGEAWKRLIELNVNSSFFSIKPVDPADVFAARTWHATDLRYVTGTVHVVSEVPIPPASAISRRAATEIRRALSKNVDLGVKVCAICTAADDDAFASGGGFQLPARWELLYDGIFARKRLCIALGFNIPKEAGSTNNTTHEGLLDTLRHYLAERDRRLTGGMDDRQAHVEARDAMREHVYGGRQLGVPKYSAKGLWVQCGVLQGEDTVPEEFRREYCGLWFHACCIGMVRAPKDVKDERVQCLRCLQDKKYRVKPPKVDQVAQLALWDARGVPRILENENGGRVPTLYLTCSCELAVGTGLPCEGMLATARSNGAVLSFRHFNSHWFGGKMIEFGAPAAVYDKNEKLQLDVDDIIGHQRQEEAPSHVSEQSRPKRAKVVAKQSSDKPDPELVVTEGGVVQQGDAGLAGVEAGDAKSGRKKSRRFKSGKNSSRK